MYENTKFKLKREKPKKNTDLAFKFRKWIYFVFFLFSSLDYYVILSESSGF